MAKLYKFHYGDKVIVHSSVWKKPCYDDEFINVCGKVGTIVNIRDGDYCSPGSMYTVKFEFYEVGTVEQEYCEAHLKKSK